MTLTEEISDWRSIVTLIVFVLTNLAVLFPFDIPVPIPVALASSTRRACARLRIVADRPTTRRRIRLPINFVTAPLIADLFLLAILAIGRQEVHDGTIGANGISPIDIMAFFLTLAYIAISVDASGLIRYLAFKVVQKGGRYGHRLFFYLYTFFFGLGSFIGNDPIILSGTAFLAYMTRVSSNIEHPRAWIHSQYAIANIASAILVSSNPTNLVLAGAFSIRFIDYTANMVVPVVITAIVMFPFLLYVVFADESLIPLTITLHELPEHLQRKKPVNPNIPDARGDDHGLDDEKGRLMSLEEVMNPFLDKGGAAFGALIMTVTLVTLLVLNATAPSSGGYPVYWVTVPAAFVMLCWDLAFGWVNRHETRDIARKGRAEKAREREAAAAEAAETEIEVEAKAEAAETETEVEVKAGAAEAEAAEAEAAEAAEAAKTETETATAQPHSEVEPAKPPSPPMRASGSSSSPSPADSEKLATTARPTLVSLSLDAYRWAQETFPTVMAVLGHLPFPLVPFALSMFVLVQALVTKGWVQVFAYGWDHWVNKTGTVGAIGGMGFLAVILCNFAGTNIGTTILLSRIIQQWYRFHPPPHQISDRQFWATVYAMALGVNYGAFSTAFSAALAGLLWRDILQRKHIIVRRLEFARVNLPIIAMAMVIGSVVLVGEVYIIRSDDRPVQVTIT